MREARVGARLVGGGGKNNKILWGGSFSMSAIFIPYVRVIFFVCGFFLLRMVRYAWSGGGGGILWLPLSPDNTFLRETLFVTYRGDHQGRSQDLGGGRAKNFFFQIWKFACREAIRFARGVRGYAPKKFFLNCAIWCVLVCILIRFSP